MRKTQWDKQGGASSQGLIRSAGRRAADSGWAGRREPREEAAQGPCRAPLECGQSGTDMLPELQVAAREEPTWSTFSGIGSSF